MRRVADRLQCPVMSLYRHLDGKNQLISLAVDAVFGEEPFPDEPPASWRLRLAESAHRQWRCYHRHPWIASVVSLARPALSPAGMREMEWAFEGLEELAMPSGDRLKVYLLVAAFVHGAAGLLAADTQAEAKSGLTGTEWWAANAPAFRQIFATGEYVHIAGLAGAKPLAQGEWFEFGLECILDGLQTRFAPVT